MNADAPSAILEVDAPAVLLTGPAGCGKSHIVRALYRRLDDATGNPGAVLVLPSRAAVEQARGSLMDAGGGVLTGGRIMTFSDLVGRLLTGLGREVCLVAPLRRRLMLQDIVRRLHQAGAFASLGPVADAPGLIGVLDAAISELKRAAIAPERFRQLAGRRPGRNGDLAAVYEAYQRRLLERSEYDPEGRTWIAHEALAEAPEGPLPGLEGTRLLLLDGFTDLGPTQLAIVRHLGRRMKVVLTLPLADDGRERMWRWTTRTRDRLRQTFGGDLHEIAIPLRDDPAPAAVLAGRCFRADVPLGEPPAALAVISAAGREAEVAAVARRIKRLVHAGARAGSIAIVARSLREYRPILQRCLPDHGLPIAPAPETLGESPVVRFLLAAAALPQRNFAFQDVLRVVKSSYFRPASLGGSAQTVGVAEMLIREGNVLEGRREYAAAIERIEYLRGLGARGEEQDDEGAFPLGCLSVTREALQAAGGMLERLFEVCEPAATASGLAGLVDALGVEAVAAELGEPELVARDLRAVAALRSVLRQVEPDTPTHPDLLEALGTVQVTAARGTSLVHVLDSLDARALRFEHVFCVGLTEDQFPLAVGGSSLLSESDRGRWARQGIALDARDDLTAREMLLFYLTLSRSEGSLTLTWPSSSESGKPTGTSPFVAGLLEGFGGLGSLASAGALEEIEQGRFVSPPVELASQRETVLAAVSGLFGSQSDPGGAALAWTVTHRDRALGLAGRGIWARRRRWMPGCRDAFDGRLGESDLLDRLARRFLGDHLFSPSQLNLYGQCPWMFFARYVLGLKPLECPQRQFEAVSRGTFIHDVLCRTFRLLQDRHGQPVRLHALDGGDVDDALASAVEAEAARIERRQPPYPVLWRLQKQQMHEQVAQYLRRQQSDDLAGQGLHFELSFGMSLRPEELHDPASRQDPVVLETDAGPIRLMGKIDRVDRVCADGQAGLLVVDYKTGRLPSTADILSGRSLQAVLYARAVQTLLGEESLGGAFHQIGGQAVRALAVVNPWGGGYRANRKYPEQAAEAMQCVGRFVAGMACGVFEVMPTHACPSWCPYRTVCHFSPARAQAKQAVVATKQQTPPGGERG